MADWPITGDDVREELRWREDQLADLDLDEKAEAAMSRLESVIGQRRGQATTVRVRAPGAPVILPAHTAAVTVHANGETLDPSTYDFDAEDGILYGPVPVGAVVTCTATDKAPPEVVEAALFLAATWVRQTKVGPARRGNETDESVTTGYGMPRRVSELIRPHVLTDFS